MAKQIPISGGKAFSTVDDEDYDFLMQWKWQLLTFGHAYRTEVISYDPATRKQTKKSVLMHRVIMNPPDGMVVNHIDGNALNNTRNNLRVTTQKSNMANRIKTGKVKSERSSIYKGVQQRVESKDPKYSACIRIEGKLKYIGTYSSEIEAAKAYNQKAIEAFGEYAHLNQIPE